MASPRTSRAVVSIKSPACLEILRRRAMCFDVCRASSKSRQARCLSVRRAQRAASSDGYDPESVILTLLSKMRRAQATRSDSRLLARCYVRAAYATPCLSIPLYDDTKSLLNCRLFRSEEHTSELQSLMRNSYAVFCLKKTK